LLIKRASTLRSLINTLGRYYYYCCYFTHQSKKRSKIVSNC